MPRNSLAGLDLDNLILTSRRGTAARNLPKDHDENASSQDVGAQEYSQTASQDPSSSATDLATPNSRRARKGTASSVVPTSQATPSPNQTSTATFDSSSPRRNARRGAGPGAVASPGTESAAPVASSSLVQAATTGPAPAQTTGIRKIVLKRKRADSGTEAPAIKEEVSEPIPEPQAQRTRTRPSRSKPDLAAQQQPEQAQQDLKLEQQQQQQQQSQALSQQAQSSSQAQVSSQADADDDDDAEGDDDEDHDDGEGDDEDSEDGDRDDEDGDTTHAADGGANGAGPSRNPVGRPVSKPPRLDANGNVIVRKRGPRGRRLKPTLRDVEYGLRDLKADDGTHYIDYFLELPSREEYPDYYKHIIQPISMREIDIRLKKRDTTYPNPYTFISDLKLMFANAKFYNEDGSPVWIAADELEKHMEAVLIPAMMKHGFTLDPNDMRKTVLPKRERPPPVPKPPKEKKISKAELREIERRAAQAAEAEAARAAAAEQAAAVSAAAAAAAAGVHHPVMLGDGMDGMLPHAGLSPSYGVPPPAAGILPHPSQFTPHFAAQAGIPVGPGMLAPAHSSPYASTHQIPLPNMSPLQSQQTLLQQGAYPAALQQQQGISPLSSLAAVAAAVAAPSQTPGPSYFPPGIGAGPAAPAPPGATSGPSPLDNNAVSMGGVQPYAPVTGQYDGESALVSEEAGTDPAAGTADVQGSGAAIVNPYTPPTVLGVRRAPVIPLIGIDVALKRKEKNSTPPAASVSAKGKGRAFHRDIRVLVENLATREHAIHLPADAVRAASQNTGGGVEEIRVRFRTCPVTSKLHARRAGSLFASRGGAHGGMVNGSLGDGDANAGLHSDSDLKHRIPWKWDITTLVNGRAVSGEWVEELPLGQEVQVDGGESMDVDGDTQQEARPRKPRALSRTRPANREDAGIAAQICTLRFRPQRGTNVIDIAVESGTGQVQHQERQTRARNQQQPPRHEGSDAPVVVPSARLDRLLEREDVKSDEELRARVMALRTMEERYRVFIVVP
ncbi:hypothetical protein OC846_001702 [Tilletia horrida]|uniref:Bromo domain-containing protein n=1 Tax=Tilletia horrida TaxID=155126 RepID=A0AAN6JVN7_9BASI|nr:hypothetical protein OC846_001702 [Tilletia horrida]